MIIIYTHVIKFTKGDRKRKARKLVEGDTMDNRNRVFVSHRNEKASATLHDNEMANFRREDHLVAFDNKPGSLLAMKTPHIRK